ncbi:MAG: AIPR family protein [Desulfomonile tiedjei]|nr:AIPR family protein [Desulfomonile tiedjei]
MSSNDLVLLNQLLDQRLSEIGQGLSEDEYFEIFSAEQVLKDDDLSYEELASGIVDGGGDGGIDSVYFFVNDVPFDEDTDVAALKKNVPLRLVLIQSKTSPGFSESAVDKMISSARDLFDLTKEMRALACVYNAQLIDRMSHFRDTFLALASKFPSVSFEYAYSTKGTEIHPNVDRKVTALEEVIRSFFSPVSFTFRFLTASDLLASARRSPSSATSLRLAENPISTGQEGFVCLVTLRDYLEFITDEDGHLRSHLFEGNVRDYQGKTEVNVEIHRTLGTTGPEDFWWLNNGVSIICANASLSGKTLTIEDAEIVNGLQSSREIYNALHGKDLSKEPRNLLVRVLKPQGEESRDRIIKATNSQTPIPAASLRATDKIHRDIEDYLYSRGYFYDRRKNYYKNVGKPIKKIFGIPFVAQSVMACALADPANARARPSSLIKSEEAYKRIFNSDYPLDVYWKCPVVVQTVEDILKQSGNEDYRKHLSNVLFYVAALWVLRQSGLPGPSVEKVATMDVSTVTPETVGPVAVEVWQEYMALGGTDQVAKGGDLKKILLEKHRQQFLQALKAAR